MANRREIEEELKPEKEHRVPKPFFFPLSACVDDERGNCLVCERLADDEDDGCSLTRVLLVGRVQEGTVGAGKGRTPPRVCARGHQRFCATSGTAGWAQMHPPEMS